MHIIAYKTYLLMKEAMNDLAQLIEASYELDGAWNLSAMTDSSFLCFLGLDLLVFFASVSCRRSSVMGKAVHDCSS